MEKYSIQQVAEILHLSKDTLRYYDKLKMVVPNRGLNNYRYYTEQDLLDLKYICVVKFSGLTLSEIKTILSNIRLNQSGCVEKTLTILENKRQDTIRNIRSLQAISSLLEFSIDQIKHKESKTEISLMVSKIYEIL